MILFTFLAVLIVVIQECFQQLLPITFPVLFVFLMVFVHKVRKQCKEYGIKNVFRMFYHGKPIEMNNYVYMMLNQTINYHIIKKWEDGILFLSESGIYIFTCLHGKGFITGNAKDKKWLCCSGKNEIEIESPLHMLQKQKEQLETVLGCSITIYLVIENHSQFLVEENKMKTILLKDVYNSMIKLHEKRYTKEQIQAYSQVIDELMSNNVNNSVIA